MRTPLRAIPAALLAVHALGAQVATYIAPFGYQNVEGNSGNTIPWWSGSATYQQVHDAADLVAVFPTAVIGIIKGLSFRKDSSASAGLSARSMDVQITLGATPVTAFSATASFASNLGPSPVVVLPYTTFSLPLMTNLSTPNPQSWYFPFAAPHVYLMSLGNLCWEMRIKNSSSLVAGYTDANSTPVINPFGTLIGTGCRATGQAAASTIGTRSLEVTSGALVHQLDRGAFSAPAAMVLGDSAQVISVPGLCTALQTLPAVSFSGITNPSGSWNLALSFGSLLRYPGARLYVQFAFADAGLMHGFGLSPCSPVTLPSRGPAGLTRVWATLMGSGQGNETATAGTLASGYGLVTGFDT